MISVGIDIGSYSIKVARIEGSAKGFHILGLDEFPLSQDPTKDTTIDILEALRTVVERYQQDGVQIVMGARQDHVSVRRKVFPFRERHKITKSLPFELEDDIPLSIENAVYDAKITHFVGGQANTLAIACPKEHIMQALNRCQDAGIDLNILSVESLALSNLFEEWLETPKEFPYKENALPEAAPAQAVLHIGHRETVGIILRDGYLLDTFVVDWGGKDLADLLAAKYNLHYVEALKELRKKGFILLNAEGASKEQIVLSDIIKAAVDDLASRVKLSLIEIENIHQVKISNAALTGGFSLLRNLGPYLTQKLEVPVNRLQHLERTPQLDYGSSPNNELAFTVAIGLAAEGVKRPKNPPLNLLKGDFARQSQSLKIFWEEWSPLIGSIACAFLVFFVWAFIRDGMTSDMVDAANSKLKAQARNVAGLRGPQASNRNIRKYIREQQQKAKQREVLESLQDINSALDVLGRISSVAPNKSAGKLNVLEMSIKNDRVQIIGTADRQPLITQLQNVLKNISKNGNVQSSAPPNQVAKGYRGYNFQFSVARRTGGSR